MFHNLALHENTPLVSSAGIFTRRFRRLSPKADGWVFFCRAPSY